MRVLCLLLFCLTTAAAIRLGFKRGKRYTYAYEGWIAHGIAEAFEKDLAVKIRAKVHFDYLKNGFVRLTLEGVNLLKVVDKVLYNDRVETNVGENEPLEDVSTALKPCLESPVKFKFKRGLVEKYIITEKSVPEWCVNIQRAVINQFYLPIRDNPLTYQVRRNENSCLGRCTTAYTILPLRPYYKYKVKRAFDLTECTYMPYILQLSEPNTDAFVIKKHGRGTAKTLNNFVRRAAYMHYDLEGNVRAGFIIHRVVSENVAELTLNGDEFRAGKIVAAHSKQTLTLLAKDRNIPPQPRVIKTQRRRTGLLFVFDLGKDRLTTTDAQNRIYEKASEHIATIAQMVTGTLPAETAIEFTRLVSILRHCTVATLRKVAKDIERMTNPRVRLVLLGAVAQVGTQAAGVVLRECVNGGKFLKELPEIAFGVGWVRGLDTAYMRHVMAICQNQHVVANVKAHRNCWLSFGTLVNRLMVRMRTDWRIGHTPRLIFFRQRIAKVLKDAIMGATDFETKITFLKAVGNAGWTTMDLFKVVRYIITFPRCPLHVKIQAIWATRHMVRVKPELIRQTLLPILANPLEDPEARASCFKIVMRVDLSITTCQMIAGVLAREAIAPGPRSNQFVSFVVSDLRTFINYDNIDRVKASRARLLLRIIPRAIYFQTLFYSKAINLPIDAGSNMGVELRLNNIIGPQTFIPRHIHTKLKLNMPGLSVDFFEFGVRMQGIHDILAQFLGPAGTRQKRSLDILSYIFGTTNEEEKLQTGKFKYAKRLPPRLETYVKLYGSEIYWGRLAEADLLEIIRDALFGGKTTKEGGCTFTAEGIKCNLPFMRAYMASEKRYMVPTLVGIPLKYSGKVAPVVKARVVANVTGVPKLITSKFEEIKAKIIIKQTTSFHMHNKAGIWLPIFETGLVVTHKMFAKQNIDLALSITQNGFNVEAPISRNDQKILELKPLVKGIMRKELVPGNRVWKDFDLVLNRRGFVAVPQTCFGEEYLNVMVCKEGLIVDPEYLRLKLLPTLPHYWLNDLSIVLKKDEGNVPKKFMLGYTTNNNDEEIYEGTGKLMIKGTTMDTMVTMSPHCEKKKWTCDTRWVFKHKKCPQTCSAVTKIDYAQANRLALNTKYGNGNEMNNEILIEEQGKALRVVNTWNRLPKWLLRYLRLNRPNIVTFLHRYFGIKGVEKADYEKRCDVKVKLVNKFLADIFVDAPTMKLRRINQNLPIAVKDFYVHNKMKMMERLHATCMVKGTNHVVTTDNVVIKQEIPGTCPFVLAEDAREEEAKWRIMLKKTEAGRQILIIEIGGIRIVFGADKSVRVNGKRIVLKTGGNKIAGGKVAMFGNKLFFQADCGFKCFFDGTVTIIVFSPWYHNRIRGICGNDDAEQWTDFFTRRNTLIPERMTRAFLREWVVEGTECQDPQCKMKAKHIRLRFGAPAGKVCFTKGRFLRCMARCTATKTQVLRRVPHHCFAANDPLVNKIQAGDINVPLETMSVDLVRPLTEHLACRCNCR